MEITAHKALRFTKIKWARAKATGCTMGKLLVWLRRNHKKIWDCWNTCGFCELYRVIDLKNDYISCGECPLSNTDVCSNLFSKWISAETKEERSEIAGKIYYEVGECKV